MPNQQASTARLVNLIQDITIRIRQEPDPCRLGAIVPQVAEVAELAKTLGYQKPPIVIDGSVVKWSDPFGCAGGAVCRNSLGYLLSAKEKPRIIETLEAWHRRLASFENPPDLMCKPGRKPRKPDTIDRILQRDIRRDDPNLRDRKWKAYIDEHRNELPKRVTPDLIRMRHQRMMANN